MSEFEIDIKKIMGEPTVNIYRKTDQLINANQELLDALYIMISAIEFPDMPDINIRRMKKFVLKYCKD